MPCFYVIYRYVFPEWRSIRPVEIKEYDIIMVTHFNITMGKDISRDGHCEITIGNDVARDIHCNVTMSNDVAMCTYHGITMHNVVAMKHFLLCILYSMPNCVILLWVVWNKKEQVYV